MVIGGKDAESQRVSTIEMFDVKTEEWEPLLDGEGRPVQLSKPLSGFAAVNYKN